MHESALAAVVKESALLALVIRAIIKRHNACLIRYHASLRLNNTLKIPLFASASGRIIAIFDDSACSGLDS